MMAHRNHQDLATAIEDRAEEAAQSLFEAGMERAAAIEEPLRTQIYRRWYRTGDDPFSRGFRARVMQSSGRTTNLGRM